MELFGILKNLSKNSVSPIVKMFVCQAVKKDFDIKDFIEEQDLETLNMLYGEDYKEYSTEMYEDSSNESDFNEYNADLVMANITTNQQ